jgi:hypothetical protein
MPNLGYRAYNAGWYFDFTIAYIGAGFITPLAVNVSMMIGAVLSWGIAWPLLTNREGSWYPAGLPSHSFEGLFACEPPALPTSRSATLPSLLALFGSACFEVVSLCPDRRLTIDAAWAAHPQCFVCSSFSNAG